MIKLRGDEILSGKPLKFECVSRTIHLVNVQDQGKAPLACPGPDCTIATYQVASANAFIGLGQIRNEMQREVKSLQGEIEDRHKSIATLKRIIGELEEAMDLESRSKEIARAVSETPDCDRPAVIANLLKKQELELSK